MAPATTAQPPAMAKVSTPKTMSSRLMTMKFMQRGAAAAAATSEVSSPATPQTDEESSAAKRRKTAHKSAPGTPATPLYDQKALKTALEEEEQKRLAAIEKRAAELGDSHWVLGGIAATPKTWPRQPLNVVQVGFAQIDYSTVPSNSEDAPETVELSVKARFYQFNMEKNKTKACAAGDDGWRNSEPNTDAANLQKQKQKQEDKKDLSSSDSDSSDEEEGEVPPVGSDCTGERAASAVTPLKRTKSNASISTRQKEERVKAQQLAGKRRKKDIKLNTLTSISAAGPQGFQKPSPAFSCHVCGKMGHKAADCPSRKQR
ncbi:hypothetical protein B0H67DRAFT_646793 [Lasiosphaeris hirsuta]|uniref:CCHC-type domain-containing protein n=1 Tax=Lasiosphaeris hirsuta TaxID=260670 RepID=A0AA40A969_9PEZI|nr:hypothetical protein B0H67DRAFT_646793 [Lasiosphaeris hirsuta]